MRILFVIFLFFQFAGFSAFGQNWNSIVTSSSAEQNSGITTKAYNNKVYFAGVYQDLMSIGFNSVVGISNNDIFFGKTNHSGFTEWIKPINGTAIDRVSNIDVVGDEIMISGNFSDSLFVGDDTLVNNYQNGAFLAYFDTLGNHLRTWVPDVYNADIIDFEYDSQGNLLMTGEFFQHFVYGNFTMTVNSGLNFFLLKYDPVQDSILWGVYSQGSANLGRQLTIDPNDEIYVTGSYNDGTYFIDTLLNTGNANHNMFIVNVDSDGNRDWITTLEGTGEVHGYGIDSDDSSNVFVVGEFEGVIDIQGEIHTSEGYFDGIVIKYNDIGQRVWSQGIGGYDSDEGYDLVLDANFDPIVMLEAGDSCLFRSDTLFSHGFNEPLLVKIKNSNGDLIWSKRLFSTQTSGIVNAAAISIDGNFIALTGINRTSIEFNSNIYLAPNNKDFYVTILEDSLTYYLDIKPNESIEMSEIKLYPNPARSSITLKSSQIINELLIFDLKGNLIQRLFVNKANPSVIVSDFEQGIYFVQVVIGEKFETHKLVKID
jgi:hypothetical protein